ncbi:MAG TPA: ABC transporter permease subunit [Phototrophicaceae bacterium]|nr:ABC transporter permease subunit [Phototrophicaceae bacterium]
MSDGIKSSSEVQYFVTTADLAASRLPNKPTSAFRVLLGNGTFWRVVALVYMLLVVLAWPTVFTGSDLPIAIQGVLFSLIICLPLAAVVLVNALQLQRRTRIPFYRNVIFIRDFIQIVFLVVILLVAFTLANNLQTNLAQSGLNINFGVIGRNFGTELTEGPSPSEPLDFLNNLPVIGSTLATAPLLQPDTVFRALGTGLTNTLRVVSLSLIATTILGILVGVGLLSANWLARNVSTVYVEVFRNTPMLVQLFFIYGGVIKALPSRPPEAVQLPGSVYISGRGLYYPALIPTSTADYVTVLSLLGLALGIGLWRWRVRLNEQTGKPAHGFQYFAGAVLGCGLAGLVLAFLSGGAPFMVEVPQMGNFNFTGGSSLSAEYVALFLGLTLYTSAFVADIVRAGIQAVPKGQLEAAHALGLSNGQTLTQIILPQALRLAVPPLTNQYLNLTKNSSLGIAIGFVDVYNVATITYNQTGQSVALFAILMVVYLALSLIISLVMNLFNSRLQLKVR